MAKTAKPDPLPPSALKLPKHAAERLLISEATLAKWRMRCIGPRFVRLSGGRVAYEEAELDRYIAACRVETAGGEAA